MATSTRRNSPLGDALGAILLFALIPLIAWMNFRSFMSEQRGTVMRVYETGTKSRTLHMVLADGHELEAWNVWFGGFKPGTQVVKRGGSFWAEAAPRTGPTPAKRILSFFVFVPAVLFPALLWFAMIFAAVESVCTWISLAVRRGLAWTGRLSGARSAAVERASPIDGSDLAPATSFSSTTHAVTARATGGCPTCGVERAGALAPCGSCGARHFDGCWAAHRTCGDAGCDGVRVSRRAAA